MDWWVIITSRSCCILKNLDSMYIETTDGHCEYIKWSVTNVMTFFAQFYFPRHAKIEARKMLLIFFLVHFILEQIYIDIDDIECEKNHNANFWILMYFPIDNDRSFYVELAEKQQQQKVSHKLLICEIFSPLFLFKFNHRLSTCSIIFNLSGIVL